MRLIISFLMILVRCGPSLTSGLIIVPLFQSKFGGDIIKTCITSWKNIVQVYLLATTIILFTPPHQEIRKQNGNKHVDQNRTDDGGLLLGEGAGGQKQRDGGMARDRS